jgi:hypothetical protein
VFGIRSHCGVESFDFSDDGDEVVAAGFEGLGWGRLRWDGDVDG